MRALSLATGLVLAACGRPAAAPATPPAPPVLDAVDGSPASFADLTRRSPWTVVVFVSRSCPCVAAHWDRLEALAKTYQPRGVQFAVVDPEVDTTAQSLATEARDYSVPVYRDEGARLANALGAEYATYTVIADRDGRPHYRGGLDSDKMTLHPDARLFVRDALEDLLAGREPRVAEGKALGCMLRKW